MKRQHLVLILTIYSIIVAGQNLVPNPSFEQFSSCPNFECQIYKAQHWLPMGNTPDYFNACSFIDHSVPTNSAGFQYAATGVAYAGIYSDIGITSSFVREYIGCELLSPLELGKKYYVYFKVSLADGSYYGINKICALFTMNSFEIIPYACNYPNNTTLFPNNYAQVCTDTVIIDTSCWTYVSGSFIADSQYQYLVLGNFFDSDSTDFTMVNNNGNVWGSYYYIDDVYVGKNSLGSINEINNESLIIAPNPTSGTLSIENKNGSLANVTLQVYDILGNIVYEKMLKNLQTQQEIDISTLSAGMYIIKVAGADWTVQKKIIKQ